MSYHKNTASVLIGMQYVPEVDFSVNSGGGVTDLHWHHTDPKPTEQDILDNLLPAMKAQRKATIRAEAKQIIETKWPDWKQRNALGGIYPEAVAEECRTDIASVIQVSNAVEDQIDAAATVEEAEAVSASWPVI